MNAAMKIEQARENVYRAYAAKQAALAQARFSPDSPRTIALVSGRERDYRLAMRKLHELQQELQQS